MQYTTPDLRDKSRPGAGIGDQQDSDDQPLAIFIHLPKTGGTTMDQILRQVYGVRRRRLTQWGPDIPAGDGCQLSIHVGHKLYPPGTWYPESLQAAAERFNQLPPQNRTNTRYITGHMGYGLGAYLPRPSFSFTMLREPVARVLSHYFFTVDWKSRPDGVSLYQHISDCLRPNLQTRFLAGPFGEEYTPSPEEMLQRAKRNLEACAVIGLTEHFDQSLMMFQSTFGWHVPGYEAAFVNRDRPRRDSLPADTLDRIAEDNQLDVALYQHAAQLFQQQVEAYGPALESDAAHYQVVNTRWQRRKKIRRAPIQLLKRVDRLLWPLARPVYNRLADWGRMRPLLPARFRPRAVEIPRPVGGGTQLQLRVGRRVVGRYNRHRQRWAIQRPFALFVNTATLPQPRYLEAFSTTSEAQLGTAQQHEGGGPE